MGTGSREELAERNGNDMKFCEECGAKLEDDVRFCEECGAEQELPEH